MGAVDARLCLRYALSESEVTVMLNSVWAVVREGSIEPLEEIDVPEGTRVLITFLPEEGAEFWLKASQVSLDKVWSNTEDDVYAELLEK